MSLEWPSSGPRLVTWSRTSVGMPSRKSVNGIAGRTAPRNRYWPRKLTPKPNPSRAMLRVHRPPPFSVWPPLTHVTLSLSEKAFWRSVRSTFRAGIGDVGRAGSCPAVNWNDGNPRRSAPRLGAFSMPSWRGHVRRLERALPPRVVVVVAGAELVDDRRREDLRPAADHRRGVELAYSRIGRFVNALPASKMMLFGLRC